jgi:hypothetical protein
VKQIPDPATLQPDTPLRLEIAAAVAFPDNSMTARRLHGEIRRGRLAGWKMGGRVYTTLAAIAAMREQCRIAPDPEIEAATLRKAAPAPDAGTMALARLKATIAATKPKEH